MGMGYSGCFSDVISNEDIIKIVGKTAEDFFKLCKEDVLDQFAQEVANDYEEFEDDTENAAEIRKLYQQLVDEFEKKTGGVKIALYYHYDEEGSRYDQIDGAFFEVWNAYELTPAAKKLVDNGIKIERKFYLSKE